jgi:hypothetical protein
MRPNGLLATTTAAYWLVTPALAGVATDATRGVERTVAECYDTTIEALGGEALHLEFESRGGEPTFEFIIQQGDVTYYAACSGVSGVMSGIDVIVAPDDSRFAGGAKISPDQAAQTATSLYPGEVEEVKAILTEGGQTLYEVDVEVEDATGEFNVWVDAASGELVRVDIEYWEIGRPGMDTGRR